jgi:hypothetical protein
MTREAAADRRATQCHQFILRPPTKSSRLLVGAFAFASLFVRAGEFYWRFEDDGTA